MQGFPPVPLLLVDVDTVPEEEDEVVEVDTVVEVDVVAPPWPPVLADAVVDAGVPPPEVLVLLVPLVLGAPPNALAVVVVPPPVPPGAVP